MAYAFGCQKGPEAESVALQAVSTERKLPLGTSSIANNVGFHWYELPESHWLQSVPAPVDESFLKSITWPINESAIREVARTQGLLLERLNVDRYRLWDIRGQVRSN